MKYLIASDFHGDLFAYQNLFERVVEENPDKVILLGDLFDFGYGGNILGINEVLDKCKKEIICVEGNCDREGFEKMFHVKNVGSRLVEKHGNRQFFFTHGHIYNSARIPPVLNIGDVLIYGHLHIGKTEMRNGLFIATAGSMGKPREGSKASYLILTEEGVTLKDAYYGEKIEEIKFDLC